MEAKANKKYTFFRKVTPEMIKLILKDIADGAPKKYAAEANGITESHFHYLVAQGIVDLNNGKTDTLHAKMVVSLRKIEKSEIISCRKDIRNSSDGHKGAQWTLERAYWRTFSNNAPAMELAEEIEKLKSELQGGKPDVETDDSETKENS